MMKKLLTLSFFLLLVVVSLFVPMAASAHLDPSTDQNAYQFFNDNGTEAGATTRAAVNTAITGVSLSEIVRLRFEVEEINASNVIVLGRIEYSSDATSCTNGTWTAMDTTATAWRITNSTQETNATATTDRISASALVFDNGWWFDTQNEDATGQTLGSEQTEWEWAFSGPGASANTTYRFRVTGHATSGTVLTTYTNCAQLTTAATVTLSQAAFGYYEDGTETGSTIIGTQDTNISRNVDSNSNMLLRVRLQEGGSGSGNTTDDYQLQYSKNSGAYTDVTTVSSNIIGFNSTNLTDGGATTNRLTAGSGSFVAGEISEDGLVDDHQITASNYTEHLYALTLVSADLANNDTLDFRVLRNGSPITYSITPRITATKTAQPSFTQNDFRWYQNLDSVTLTSLWGNLATQDNLDIRVIPAGNNPPGVGEKLRLQVNITVADAPLSATTQAFQLQYKAGTDESCSTGSWVDVGAKGSSTVAWRFFDNAGLADTTTEVNQISTSDVAGGYSEVNPTGTNPLQVLTGQDMEWDFPIESVSGQVQDATTYAFRVVKSGGTVISYTAGDCPTLETEPGTANLLRHGGVFVDGSEKGLFWAD